MDEIKLGRKTELHEKMLKKNEGKKYGKHQELEIETSPVTTERDQKTIV